jgi:hypothetical protein
MIFPHENHFPGKSGRNGSVPGGGLATSMLLTWQIVDASIVKQH